MITHVHHSPFTADELRNTVYDLKVLYLPEDD